MRKMKNILYLSNIEVPYRVKFFNELSKYCNLTVVYERKRSSNRDATWANSQTQNYKVEYLNGINIKNENTFSFKILKYVLSKKKYDAIIIGCYNSFVQMFAILMMKLFRVPYIINLDGELFLGKKGIKNKIKKFFLKGAKKYLIAGEKSATALRQIILEKEIISYGFSSLTIAEIDKNSQIKEERTNNILVVGQYFDYKGMDIALKVARKNREFNYKFVGMGNRSELFKKEQNIDDENIEIIPFLQKEDLEREMAKSVMLVLPSRQECWGLTINEAASFGTPIVSTYGSGAGVEFLSDKYPQYLATPSNVESLYSCIENLMFDKEKDEYSKYLINKSKEYSIEKSVESHLIACEIDV